MFRQDASLLNCSVEELPFEKYGCKLCSYFFWLEQCKNVCLLPDVIVRKTVHLLQKGLITADLSIHRDKELSVPVTLGIPAVGAKREGPDYKCQWNELEILWLQKTTSRATYNHFVPGDGKGNMVWDSLGIRKGRDDYHIAGKRVIVLDPEWCRKNWRSHD